MIVDNDPVNYITVHKGHKVAAYSYGEGDNVLMLLNGGPGNPSIDIRKCFEPLANKNLRIVSFDQLGTGRSDCPDDTSLWTIERYAEEVEMVCEQMGLEKLHILGHSWGGMLAIEYAVTFPERLRSLILEGTIADVEHHQKETKRLRLNLGPETEVMMQRHEAQGTMDHPEYQAAMTILHYRHVVRMDEPPETLKYQFENDNKKIYRTMQGENEFIHTGNLAGWSRLADLHKITCPVQIFVGEFDHLTPECSRLIKQGLPNSKLYIFRGCGHGPRREAVEEYRRKLIEFLDSVE